jgi:beta-mannosidase
VTTVTLPAALLEVADAGREVLVADVDGIRATRLFAEDFDLAYDPAAVTAEAVRTPDGYAITVTASAFARDVTVLADRVAPDAVVDDMLVDLLAGESRTFTVRTAAAVDPAAFIVPQVLRSANSLSTPARTR